MKYSIITFGCRVNQADSLGFEEELRAAGAMSSDPAAADLVIVNTCSVTATSDQGARQTIRRVARENPHARIVVTGCYATRSGAEVQALPNVAHVVANDDKGRLVAIARPPLSNGVRLPPDVPHGPCDEPPREGEATTAERFGDGDGSCGAAIEPGVAGRTAFTLRVQTGCDEPCAYCIIPSTRGRPRSVPLDAVIREVGRISGAGFKEIALTGVHLGSYGRDLEPRASLVDLLGALGNHKLLRDSPAGGGGDAGGVLFRISSLEPMDCSPAIVDLVASHDAFAPHFHLPLQHASNRLLAAMRRPYTIEYYAALVDSIRTRLPHASIGTDVIVGFPGESDADAEALVDYLASSPLTHVHVFPYSDRPGTSATAMRDKVHGAAVRERGRRVREVAEELTARFRASQIGTVHRALTLEDGSLVVTGNYLKLRIPPGRTRNEWVRVKVLRDGLGEPVEPENR